MSTTIKRKTALGLVTCVVAGFGASTVARADAPPPTNGGNGGGASGQCTGNPADRPASCGP